MSRRVYLLKLRINDRGLQAVEIDPHYEDKHAASVTDETILTLVKQLNGRTFRPVDTNDQGFQYFVNAYRR